MFRIGLQKILAFSKHLGTTQKLTKYQACVHYSSQLRTMKIDSPLFKALFTPELETLADLFKKNGFELRIAGGAVRDLLMNKQAHDIDFATTATPDQMKELFTTEGIRMINNRGERHGTITARINEQNFEVTTLRIDVVTDGRHAEVQFTTDWQLDANRRDLTVNSLFLGLDGTLYDYFHGVDDLEKRRVAFVGDAVQRIQEDYLRILRYFRFYGKVSVEPNKHEAGTLEAIRQNAGGLAGISGERLWVELKKILTGNHVKELVLLMIELGVQKHVGLPEAPNINQFKVIWERVKDLQPHAITLLATLLENEEQMMNLHGRLKLSAFERDLGLFLVYYREQYDPTRDGIRPLQEIVINSKSSRAFTQDFCVELLKYSGGQSLLAEMKDWQQPKFPLSGKVLVERGIKSPKKFQRIMGTLRQEWIDSGFTMTSGQLEERIDDVIKGIGSPR